MFCIWQFFYNVLRKAYKFRVGRKQGIFFTLIEFRPTGLIFNETTHIYYGIYYYKSRFLALIIWLYLQMLSLYFKLLKVVGQVMKSPIIVYGIVITDLSTCGKEILCFRMISE